MLNLQPFIGNGEVPIYSRTGRKVTENQLIIKALFAVPQYFDD